MDHVWYPVPGPWKSHRVALWQCARCLEKRITVSIARDEPSGPPPTRRQCPGPVESQHD